MTKISPKAFFFDFDGVICDSEKLHMVATQEAIKRFSITFAEEYYIENLFGFDDRLLFAHLFEINNKDLTPQMLEELMEHKNAVFMDLLKTNAEFFPGAIELIIKLHALKIPLAVVSGSLSHEVNESLSLAKIKQYFEFTVCADDVKNGKPDPESYIKAFEGMKKTHPTLNPADCFVLEDSPVGIEAAKGAGLRTIGITNTTKADNLRNADYVVEKYEEIKPSKT